MDTGRTDRSTWTVVSVVLLGFLVVAVGAGQFAGSPSDARADPSVLTVGPDSDAEYNSIQAAIDDAGRGETVRVKRGVYKEQLVLGKSITLVAPNGTTLAWFGGGRAAVGIRIPAGSDAAPVIDGFEITGFAEAGLRANETTGDWVLRNASLGDVGVVGVQANRSTGDWRVVNATVSRNGDKGIDAENSTGAWTILESTLARNAAEGLEAENSTGAWTIRDSDIRSNGDDGIDADGATSGDWLLSNTTVRDNGQQAVDITGISSDWTIHDATIVGNRWGVVAANTTGDWTITSTRVSDHTETAVVAVRAEGDWTIDGSVVEHSRVMGVRADHSGGAWTIADTRMNNSSVGVSAASTTGDWRITNATVRNVEAPVFVLAAGGTGVYAADTAGAWQVHGSTFARIADRGIDATGAERRGNATRNWWGPRVGVTGADCVGDVDCGNPLSAPPNRGLLDRVRAVPEVVVGLALPAAVALASVYRRYGRGR